MSTITNSDLHKLRKMQRLGVSETDQRRQCLDLGERHGLDILSITKLVVETVGNAGPVNFITADAQLNASTTDVSINRRVDVLLI